MPFIDPEKRRAYQKKWNKNFYLKNRVAEIARVAKRKQDLRNWLDDYKKTLKCAKCDEKHPACLDFHHRDGGVKDFQIGNIKEHGWGKKKVLKEIEKCIVLCANCHRKIHSR